MLFSKGNRKLPKETWIFNLPAIKSCPGSTKECRQWCYARKAERMYPQVLPFREKNFKLSKNPFFYNNLIMCIVKARKKPKQIRIHESGDFYSQKYFDQWRTVANTYPSIIFYGYTKNFNLDLSMKPNNMILLASDDNKKYTISQLKKMGFDGYARVSDKIKKNEFLCKGSCKICNYCYKKGEFKKLIFKKH